MSDIDPFRNRMGQWILSHGLPQRMASLTLRPGKLQYTDTYNCYSNVSQHPYGNGHQQSGW